MFIAASDGHTGAVQPACRGAPLVVGDHLRRLWRNGLRDMEVLRVEVYTGGGIVLKANSALRYVQLKSSRRTAARWIANRYHAKNLFPVSATDASQHIP